CGIWPEALSRMFARGTQPRSLRSPFLQTAKHWRQAALTRRSNSGTGVPRRRSFIPKNSALGFFSRIIGGLRAFLQTGPCCWPGTPTPPFRSGKPPPCEKVELEYLASSTVPSGERPGTPTPPFRSGKPPPCEKVELVYL